MKLVLKIILWIIIIIAAAAIGFYIYVSSSYPDVGKSPDIKVESSQYDIARGEYLANYVSVCIDCHSERDWSVFSGPIISGTEGKGGEIFDEKKGFPGKFYAANITPYNLKDHTDGEIYRAITTGVNKKGEAIFPVMPYLLYGKMDNEDIYDIIAYVRTLKPIKNDVEESSADFPMSFILPTIPKKGQPQKRPNKEAGVEYGAYIINAAACYECHTPFDRGQPIKEKAFAGGRKFQMQNGIVHSSNITPDKRTGIGNWSEKMFVVKFHAFAEGGYPVGENEVNTIMPWTMYAKMDSTDLRAIYHYLMSLDPIHNKVNRFSQNR